MIVWEIIGKLKCLSEGDDDEGWEREIEENDKVKRIMGVFISRVLYIIISGFVFIVR